MTSVADQRVNLMRHMMRDHRFRDADLLSLSLSDMSVKHDREHPHDLGDVMPNRSHLVAVLKGKYSDPEGTQ